MTNHKIHWLGAGLASGPGLRRLIKKGLSVVLWEKDLGKAKALISGLEDRVELREAEEGALDIALGAGDVVVSMLPAALHPRIAKLCLEKKAHFVSSSYIGPEMAAFDEAAKEKQLCFVNEMGLDPGIDHMLAHLLVADYRASASFDPNNDHDFQSYCGGFPAIANDFRYKFSWSPLGVIKALKSPAKAIFGKKEVTTNRPWELVADQPIALPHGVELFESYPNRDSLTFLADYGIGHDWGLTRFVRGTLRLPGWSKAWASIFKLLDRPDDTETSEQLQSLSDRLWHDHAYREGEFDRVVLSVDLKVSRDGQAIWHKTKSLDAIGNAHSSAMARLVSIPVSLATEAVLAGEMSAGVQSAPKDPAKIRHWLEVIAEHGDMTYHSDFCSELALIAAE